MRASLEKRALGSALAAALTLFSATSAWGFRPDQEWGHRGVTAHGLEAFKFSDPVLGTDDKTGKLYEIGFTDLAIDSIALANEETDDYLYPRFLSCVANASSSAANPPFFAGTFHCDDDLLGECSEAVRMGLEAVVEAISTGVRDPQDARTCLGRILHTVQDFYAHSSSVWRLLEGSEDKYRRMSMTAADGKEDRQKLFSGTLAKQKQIQERYKSAPVCGGYRQLNGLPVPVYSGHEFVVEPPEETPLVSGYFPELEHNLTVGGYAQTFAKVYGFSPEPGRCSHGIDLPPGLASVGDVVVGAPGIAKDPRNEPTPWQHQAALQLATIATLELMKTVSEEVGQRVTDPIELSERMRKFLGHAAKASTPILSNFAAVIDISKSMRKILENVENSVKKYAIEADSQDGDSQLVLVSYVEDKDNNLTTDTLVTGDIGEFDRGLSELAIGDGGDCPEPTNRALEEAVYALNGNGRVIAFTNSTTKDRWRSNLVIDMAQKKNITVNINVSGSCSPIDPSYRAIAEATGGQVIQTERDDGAAAGEVMGVFLEDQLAGEQELIARVSRVVGDDGEETLSFPVDSSVTRLTVSTDMSADTIVTRDTAEKGKHELLDPDGQSVAARVDGMMGNLYAVDGPKAGTWTLRVSDAAGLHLSAAVRAHTDLKLSNVAFAEERGRLGHSGVMRIAHRPIAEKESHLFLNLSEPNAKDLEFSLLSLEGEVLKTFSLSQIPLLSGLAGTLVPEDVPFRVAVSGRREDGTSFQRVYPTLFASSPFLIEPVLGGGALTVGHLQWRRYRVTNFGDKRTVQVWAHTSTPSEVKVSPEELELERDETGYVEIGIELDDVGPEERFTTITAEVGEDQDDQRENRVNTEAVIDADRDGDGVADSFESGPSGDDAHYDGNGDGSPDLEQDTVLSLPLLSNQYASVEFEHPLTVSALRRDPDPGPEELPEGAVTPLGTFLLHAELQGSATAWLYLPAGSRDDLQGVFMEEPEGGFSLHRAPESGQGGIAFELTDGGETDLDGKQNGLFTARVAPGYLTPAADAPAEGGCSVTVSRPTRGGSGGAFIAGLFLLGWMSWRRRRPN